MSSIPARAPARPCRQPVAAAVLAMSLVPLAGCYGQLLAGSPGGWDKMAYAHAEPNFRPPKPIYTNFVRRLGSEKFTNAMAARCRLPHHLYAIGWFGSLWHVDVVAAHLDATDAEMRETALAAFNRLTNRRFKTGDEALDWWTTHRNEFLRW